MAHLNLDGGSLAAAVIRLVKSPSFYLEYSHIIISIFQVGGQDGGTLAPGAKEEDNLEMFIDLMCRKLPLKFEKKVEHAGLESLRFIPPPNALGSADDANLTRR